MTENNIIYSDSTEVNNGVATIVVTEPLSPGTYTVIGNYPETDNYQEGEGTGTLNINSASTQCTLVSNTNALELGSSATLTITVTAEGNHIVKDGTVTIYEDDIPILFNQTLDTNGTCTVTYAPTTHGSHTLYAHYSGVNNVYVESDSGTVTVKVTKTPTVTILSPDVLYSGEPTTYKARVTYNNQPIAGRCLFKVSGKTLKDSDGKVIYITLDNNGYVTLDMDAPTTSATKTAHVDVVYTDDTEYARVTASQDVMFYAQTENITPTITWGIDEIIEEIPSGNYHIKATIKRPDGHPIQGATVVITGIAPDETSWQSSNITTDANGGIDVIYPNTLTRGDYTFSLIVNGTTANGTNITQTTSTFDVTVKGEVHIENLTCTYQQLESNPLSDNQTISIETGLNALNEIHNGELNSISDNFAYSGKYIVLDFELSEEDYSYLTQENITEIIYDMGYIDEATDTEYISWFIYNRNESTSQLGVGTEDGVDYTFENVLYYTYKAYNSNNDSYHFGIIISKEDVDTTGEFEFPNSAIPTMLSITILSDDDWQLSFDDTPTVPENWWVFN